MDVSSYAWCVTLAVLVVALAVDIAVVGRRPHEPSVRESASWVVLYVSLAVLFGIGLWLAEGGRYAGEFFAGWLTEYSLSVDNLVVFLVIMTKFAVPRVFQQKVLLVGIVLALVMRGGFIAAGAALIDRFEWVLYLFGAFLLYTAVNLARQGEPDDVEVRDNPLIRLSRRVLPVVRSYGEGKLTVVTHSGRRRFTPMLIVMIAIGTTDLMFALDSIPAIFGITSESYLVFTSNVFALMGLMQLFFLLGGLLERLVYLNAGLAVVLAFIGVKLVLEALHDNELPFLNGGAGISWAPVVPVWLSLTVIVVTLGAATVASLAKSARDRRRELVDAH